MNKNVNDLKIRLQEELPNKIVLFTINNEILSNFGENNMEDQNFYSTLSKFWKDKIISINIEIEKFLNWINDYSIFFNNRCVVLSNDYWSFNNISLQGIKYLKEKAKNNDVNKLEEVHKIISDSL